MTKETLTPDEADHLRETRQDSGRSLRQRAEDVVQRRPEEMQEIPSEDIQDLIHELQVHQVELEMQNEELRRAQQELELSRDRYSNLYEFAPVGYITVSEKGTILEANLTAATMLGVERGRLIKQPLSHFIAEDDQDIYYHHRRELFGTQKPQTCEMRMVRGDGRQFWAQIEARTSVDKEGEVVCRAILSDATQRKRMEKHLKESEKRFRILFNNLKDGIFVHPVLPGGQPGPFEQVNEAACEMLGYSPEEFSNMTPWDLDDPDTRDDYIPEAMREIGEKGQTVFEAVQVAKDGHKVPVEVNANLVDLQGKPYIISVVRDITERRAAEEQLAFQSMLLDQIQDRVTATDLEGEITYVNQAECRVFGKTTDELVGQHVESYGEDSERGATQQEIIDETLKEGEWRGEVVNFTEDGHEIILDCRTQLVHDGSGEPVGMVGVSTDITERKQLEEELKRSNKELEQFAYVISHDLREPARMVKSYLELLENRYQGKLDEKANMFIDHAVDGAKRMQEMIKALLDLSRVGTRSKEPTPTDAEAVLERTLRSLGRAIEEAEAEVTYDPLPTVMTDQAQLAQVFQNLIANAIKFQRDGVPPRIHISVEQAGDEWVFSVVDNGIGIDPEQADRIFQIFQRLHTREEYPGLGIGLALCKRIVERHGGRIWVESTPGNGTTLLFTLPASR